MISGYTYILVDSKPFHFDSTLYCFPHTDSWDWSTIYFPWVELVLIVVHVRLLSSRKTKWVYGMDGRSPVSSSGGIWTQGSWRYLCFIAATSWPLQRSSLHYTSSTTSSSPWTSPEWLGQGGSFTAWWWRAVPPSRHTTGQHSGHSTVTSTL